MKRISLAAIALVLAFTFAGCPRTDGTDNSNLNTTVNDNSSGPDLNANINSSSDDPTVLTAGTWQRVSGELFGGGPSELTYLVLNDGATGEVYFRHAEIRFTTCYDAIYSAAATSLVVTVGGFGEGDESFVLTRQQPDADTLVLGDVGGGEAVFTRVDAVPDEFLCRDLAVLNTYAGLPEPDGWSGMAYDATEYLWYTNADIEQQAVSPAGVIGPTLDLTTPYVHAFEGNGDSGLWVFAASGSMEVAQRRDRFNVLLDSVDTSDLGAPNEISAIAYAPDGHVLWLHGQSNESDGRRLLQVINHHDPDPDELLSARDFDVLVQALSWHGTSLWAIVESGRDAIVEIDPDTLQALNTYVPPLEDVDWIGLAWVDDSLYLIGERDHEGVLIQTQP